MGWRRSDCTCRGAGLCWLLLRQRPGEWRTGTGDAIVVRWWIGTGFLARVTARLASASMVCADKPWSTRLEPSSRDHDIREGPSGANLYDLAYAKRRKVAVAGRRPLMQVIRS